MLTLAQIDLGELADLLDRRDYGSGYLDPETGEVYPAYDGQILGLSDDGDPVDTWAADTEGFIALGGEGGRDVYRDMELFASWVGDRRVRQQLTDALDGPKPMRASGRWCTRRQRCWGGLGAVPQPPRTGAGAGLPGHAGPRAGSAGRRRRDRGATGTAH